MRAQLIFGEPVVVAQGPTWEEAGWGPYQFPAIQSLPDGRIAVSYSAAQDRAEDYARSGLVHIGGSGKTWQAVSPRSAGREPALARTAVRKVHPRYQPRPVPLTPVACLLSEKWGRGSFAWVWRRYRRAV